MNLEELICAASRQGGELIVATGETEGGTVFLSVIPIHVSDDNGAPVDIHRFTVDQNAVQPVLEL